MKIEKILSFGLLLLLPLNVFASSMSDVDWMTREALEVYYQNENTKINPFTEVFNLHFIDLNSLSNPNQCDFEVAALVRYQKNNKKFAEYCQVCFVYLDEAKQSFDYQDAFCF